MTDQPELDQAVMHAENARLFGKWMSQTRQLAETHACRAIDAGETTVAEATKATGIRSLPEAYRVHQLKDQTT